MCRLEPVIPVLQIVGYQNSGKTRFVGVLIEHLTERGWRVGVIKHHGHGGEPDTPVKDSSRHRQSGARLSAVIGESLCLLETSRTDAFDWLLACYAHEVDIVVVEGYKQKAFPKIVLKREGREVPEGLTNILAVGDAFLDERRLIDRVERWIQDELVQSE